MIPIWNRRELTTTWSMAQQTAITAALREAGLDYAVKTVDRTSPSAWNAGSRARGGTFGQPAGQQYEYVIYVRRADYTAARTAASLSEIR